jgi:hypothetical protein
MSKETIKVVEIDTNPAVKSLKDLRKELLEYKNQMANLEEGSDAFLEIANKAGEVKHQIDEINESIKGASADFGDMVGNVTNVAACITGAFQAVAGGLQAIGVESEAIDKTIVKMQGLMAVTQGLSAIDDGIKSFDKLSTAIKGSSTAMKAFKIISNPVVLAGVAAVVVTIGAAWNKWGDSIKKSLPWLDEFIKKFDGTAAKEAERLAEAQRKFNEELAVSNKEVAEILKNRKWNAITKEAQDKIKFLEDEIKIYENNVKKIVKQQETASEAEWNRLNEIGKGYLEQIRLWKQEIDDYYNNPKYQLSNQKTPTKPKTPTTPVEDNNVIEPFEGIVDITDEITKKLQDKYDIQLEQLKRSNKEKEEYLTAEIEIERKRLSLYTEGSLEYEKQLTHIFNLENELKELTETSTEVLREKTEEVREMGNAIFENLKSTVDMFADSSLGISNGWIESLNQFQTVFTMTMDTVDKKGKATWKDYGNIATTALSGIGSVLNTLSQEQDASTEEGFKKTKQFQIAATIMNMLSGIMNAWTSAMSPSNAWMTVAGQIAMGTAMSGMIAGIGAAQIEKIKNATMSSANPNTNINAKSVNSMIIPPVQFSSAVQGASTEGVITNQKVYVLESDIVNTIGKVNVQESENTY